MVEVDAWLGELLLRGSSGGQASAAEADLDEPRGRASCGIKYVLHDAIFGSDAACWWHLKLSLMRVRSRASLCRAVASETKTRSNAFQLQRTYTITLGTKGQRHTARVPQRVVSALHRR
jgi:hypothetical protein